MFILKWNYLSLQILPKSKLRDWKRDGAVQNVQENIQEKSICGKKYYGMDLYSVYFY